MLEGFTTAVYTVLSLAGGAFLLGLAKSAAATRDERARLLSLALLALAPTLLALLGRSLRRLLSLNWNVFWWPLADACVVLFLAVFTHLALVTVASWQGAKPPRTALLALYLPVPVLAPVYLSQWWWSGEAYRAVWGFDSDGADVVLVVLGAAYGAVALAAWRRGYGTPSAHAARWGYRGTLAALLSWVAVDGFLPLLPPAPPARAATAGLAVLPELLILLTLTGLAEADGFLPKPQSALLVRFFRESAAFAVAIALGAATAEILPTPWDTYAATAGSVGLFVSARLALRALSTPSKPVPADDPWRRLAYEDALTGLGNRRAFDLHLGEFHARATRDRSPFALVLFDLDRFKGVNDRHGHVAGDDLLRTLGRVAAAATERRGHRVYRIGGDEFALLVPDLAAAEVEVLCEQLRTAVKAALADSGVTISIGYALCTPGDPRSPTDILRAADQALYRAKAAGGNRVVPT